MCTLRFCCCCSSLSRCSRSICITRGRHKRTLFSWPADCRRTLMPFLLFIFRLSFLVCTTHSFYFLFAMHFLRTRVLCCLYCFVRVKIFDWIYKLQAQRCFFRYIGKKTYFIHLVFISMTIPATQFMCGLTLCRCLLFRSCCFFFTAVVGSFFFHSHQVALWFLCAKDI